MWNNGSKVERVNERRLCHFEGTRKPPLYCSPWMTQACCGHSMRDPHVTHSTQVVGKRNWRGSYCDKTPPCVHPRIILGLAQ